MKSSLSIPESVSSSSSQDNLALVNSAIQPVPPSASGAPSTMSTSPSDTPLPKAGLKSPKSRTKRKSLIGIKEIAAMLADNAIEFCEKNLPEGHLSGQYWICGDVDGNSGKSLTVCIDGEHVGMWRDWATGEHGDLIDLIQIKEGCTKSDALKKAKTILGITDGDATLRQTKTPEQRKAELEAAHQREEERHRKAAAQAAEEYAATPPCTKHVYLTQKMVSPCTGLHISTQGDIIVPLTDMFTGKITSVQYILQQPMSDGRNKRFLKNGVVAGSSFLIAGTSDSESQPLYLCEGLATGLSIHEVTNGNVLMCATASNMLPIAKKARQTWPNRPFVFCADNDRFDKRTGKERSEKENTGIQTAKECAKAVGGTVVIPPLVETNKSADWNDVAVARKKACQTQDDYDDFKAELSDQILSEEESYPIPSPEEQTNFTATKPEDAAQHPQQKRYSITTPQGWSISATPEQVQFAVENYERGAGWLYFCMYLNRLLFDTAAKQWYFFNGCRWRPDFVNIWRNCFDGLAEIVKLDKGPWEKQKAALKKQLFNISQQSRDLVNSVSELDKAEYAKKTKELEKKSKRLQKELKELDAATGDHDKLLRNLNGISFRNNAGEFAHDGIQSLAYDGKGWDAEPYVLPCANGIIDLKTGKLRQGQPSDRLLSGTHIEADSNAQCPRWQAFLESCFPEKPEMVAYLKRLVGYATCRDPKEQVFSILTGTGGNGKSVFIDVIMNVLGGTEGIACALQPEMLMDSGRQHSSGQARADLMSLRGKAIAVASEANTGGTFNAAVVKRLTGQDPITARAPFGIREITFMPTHVLIFLTNSLPRIDAADSAMWRRVHLVRFEQDFTANPNKNLKHELAQEYSGILQWIIDGALEWQRIGLNPPTEVTAATNQYREDMDILGEFFRNEVDYIDNNNEVKNDTINFRKGCYIKSTILHTAYTAWAKASGFKPFSLTRFGQQMSKRDDIDKMSDKHKSTYYRLKESIEQVDESFTF